MLVREIDISSSGLDITSIVNCHKILPPVSLLESSLYNKDIGRYSIAGALPFMILEGIPGGCKVTCYTEGGEIAERLELQGDPFSLLEEQYARYNVVANSEYPLWGGAIGYFSYELLYYNDRIGDVSEPPNAGIELPLYWFAFYDTVCLEDKTTGKISLLSTDLGCRERDGNSYIEKKIELFKRHLSPKKKREAPEMPPMETCGQVSQIGRDEYVKSVKEILGHIKDGDIFQACYTFTKKMPFLGESQDIYLLLREKNPAPFSAFIATGDLEIACCSPERFLKVSPDGTLETRPIKGTRGRGRNAQEDLALQAQLRGSEKDRAENIMITDLLRNDLGRVCALGSVKVKELFRIEEYANVFQLVSIIEGRGKYQGRNNSIAYIKSLFPGGSMTGAPKKRALEILHTLERSRRGIYSGSIGYLGFNNSCDFNIVIRSAVIRNAEAFIGTGGGIIADSDPESEYQEAEIKVKNIVAAINYLNHRKRASREP